MLDGATLNSSGRATVIMYILDTRKLSPAPDRLAGE